MDGLSLHVAARELQCLIDGKIDKIQQPDCDALIFTIRSKNGTKKLLINAHAQNGRIHLTQNSFETPDTAPAFCMLLRKRLIGGRILSIGQTGTDRILTVSILTKNEFFDEIECRLVTELMGKYSNITLIGPDGRVIDAIHRVPLGVSSVRAVLPGLSYCPPPEQEKTDPFSLAETELSDALEEADGFASYIASHFQGFSKSMAEKFTYGCVSVSSVVNRFHVLKSGNPVILLQRNEAGEPVGVFPFPVENGERAASLSEAYDTLYFEKDRLVHIRRNGSSLRRSVENILKRDENKLSIYNASIDNAGEFEIFRLYGDLLMANLYKLKSGPDAVTLENIYSEDMQPVKVPLDPSLTPVKNAEKYYKKYKKSRAARTYALERKGDLLEEIEYLEGELDCIDKCQTTVELDEIREELIHGGFLREDKKKRKGMRSAPSRPMHFVSDDGIDLFVGKNNRQNDDLTLRKAEPKNYFVHVKDMPGSHVIIQCEGEPPATTLTQACQLAAYYSKGRSSASVPVDYTLRKYVKKPSGARPGKVIYSTNKTAFVTPDPGIVATLRRVE